VGASKVPTVSTYNNQNRNVLSNLVNKQLHPSPIRQQNQQVQALQPFKQQQQQPQAVVAERPQYIFDDLVEEDEENECRMTVLDDDHVQFAFALSDGVESMWTAKMCQVLGRPAMLIDVDKQMCRTGSKEGFVRLLEYAEEELCCEQVYVCLRRDHTDMKAIMRTFMYLGFALAPPAMAQILNLDLNTTTLLVYNIE